jgi:hypothetical protein
MAKRTPLVCQHLENISREALEKYQDIVRRYGIEKRDVVENWKEGTEGRHRVRLKD